MISDEGRFFVESYSGVYYCASSLFSLSTVAKKTARDDKMRTYHSLIHQPTGSKCMTIEELLTYNN